MLQMEFLNISDVKLGDNGFYKIASCVTKIEQLWICQSFDPHLSIKGIRELVQKIMERNKPVNYINNECIFHIMKSLATCLGDDLPLLQYNDETEFYISIDDFAKGNYALNVVQNIQQNK